MKMLWWVILILSWFCGCSRSGGGSGPAAVELLVAEQELAWADGNSLFVEKRNGDVVEGIRLVRTDTAGSQTVVTSPRGRITKGSDMNSVILELDDVTTVRGRNQMRVQRMTIILKR